jgi:propanol-preferring alcohol dehydrogenase
MRAVVLNRAGTPLRNERIADPHPAVGQVLVKVLACGVCRTDLHVVDGDLSEGKLPIIPGHEIVGRVEALGSGVSGLRLGGRIGVPWLGHSCGVCCYCQAGAENLCDAPSFTG